MKRVLLFAAAVVLSAGAFAQQKKAEDVVKFKEMTFDFGKIKQSVPATHSFEFTNISNTPVVIESATPSCGCTTPFKPDGPVPQGKTDKITASYNAVALGTFNKTITVKISGVDVPLQLHITGEVLNADAYAKYQTEKTSQAKPAKSGL